MVVTPLLNCLHLGGGNSSLSRHVSNTCESLVSYTIALMQNKTVFTAQRSSNGASYVQETASGKVRWDVRRTARFSLVSVFGILALTKLALWGFRNLLMSVLLSLLTLIKSTR